VRILITGATGFVGTHAINVLQGGEHKLALLVRDVHKALHLKRANTTLLIGNLGELDAVKDSIKEFAPQACIHLSWTGIPDYSAVTSKLNLYQSIELIDFLSTETKCKKIIISGSCFEYGKIRGECNESEPVRTTSFIAWAKQSLHNYSLLLCEQSSINLIWFRVFYVYGPGQRTNAIIPTVVQAFLKGEKPCIHNQFNSNDFIYVEDVAEAIRLAIEKDADSGIYNLGSGKATSILEVCRVVEDQVSGSKVFSEFPKQSASGDHVCFWANITKTKKAFGWEPRYSLSAGVQRYTQLVQRS